MVVPMPVFQATAFYQFGSAGWSMALFASDADYSAVMTKLQATNTALMGCMRNDVKCVGLRVSNADVFRDAITANATTPVGTYAAVGAVTSFPALALQVRVLGTPTKRAMRFIHALPSDVVNGANYAPDPGFTTNLNAFFTSCIGYFGIGTKTGNPYPGPRYLFTVIAGMSAGFLTERKVGRPFNLFRGRRRVA
jgi:hypothetical protein